MSAKIMRLENNTDAFISLPPLEGIEKLDEEGNPIEGEFVDFPSGIKLAPGGLTTVPALYLNALAERATPVCDARGLPRKDKKGNQIMRYPGREALEILQQPVTFTSASGNKFGPRITIYEASQVSREDGPQAPATLPSNTNAALTVISVVEDKKALERYMKASKDPQIKVAIQSRMAALKAGG